MGSFNCASANAVPHERIRAAAGRQNHDLMDNVQWRIERRREEVRNGEMGRNKERKISNFMKD